MDAGCGGPARHGRQAGGTAVPTTETENMIPIQNTVTQEPEPRTAALLLPSRTAALGAASKSGPAAAYHRYCGASSFSDNASIAGCAGAGCISGSCYHPILHCFFTIYFGIILFSFSWLSGYTSFGHFIICIGLFYSFWLFRFISPESKRTRPCHVFQ